MRISAHDKYYLRCVNRNEILCPGILVEHILRPNYLFGLVIGRRLDRENYYYYILWCD